MAGPEPFTTRGLSISEDVAVVGGLWAAVRHPWFFLFFFGLFFLVSLWMIPRLWRGIKYLLRRLTDPTGSPPGIDPTGTAGQ